MHLGIPNQTTATERRVGAPPGTVASLIELGFRATVESGAGNAAGFSDAAYRDVGASVIDRLTPEDPADLLIAVAPPSEAAIASVGDGGIVLGFLDPASSRPAIASMRSRRIVPVAMEQVPRSTLAQSMDALSSQATGAGYAAVLLGATRLPKFLPMLVTAAGTIAPARVLILGVGVAGLQAIATAKRLGAVVFAYDIRPETREQVESLGAKFIDAPTQEMDEGGYARAVDESTAIRQREILADVVAKSDLVITTAQVPGRTAPRLVDRAMVEAMEPGSVIIDMAASSGGNVEGSVADREVDIGGVYLLGPTDLASRVAADSSRMYGRNILEMVKRMVTAEGLSASSDDPVIGPAIVDEEQTR